jgi:D-alanine-D-alanine ligase
MSKKKTVAVLMGGWSGERDVSLTSGKEILNALQNSGYKAIPIDVSRNMEDILQSLTPPPDVAFNALHGKWGEDGRIQAILEILNIPYTHSGLTASCLAMNKHVAKQLFVQAGLKTPSGFVAKVSDILKEQLMPFPYVLKPLQEGSSLGVSIIREVNDVLEWHKTWDFGDDVLIEEYIPGKEIQVAVMGDRALGAIEIVPKEGFYDYTAKYTEGKALHVMPAGLHPVSYERALDLALKAHQVLGCSGVSRVDFRYDDTKGVPGEFYVLEVNTQPGMTPLSLVPEIAAHVGISFEQLLEWMVENPKCPD